MMQDQFCKNKLFGNIDRNSNLVITTLKALNQEGRLECCRTTIVIGEQVMDAVHVLSRRSGTFQHRYLYMNDVPI